MIFDTSMFDQGVGIVMVGLIAGTVIGLAIKLISRVGRL